MDYLVRQPEVRSSNPIVEWQIEQKYCDHCSDNIQNVDDLQSRFGQSVQLF